MVPLFHKYPLKLLTPLVDYFLAFTWFNKTFSDCIAKENGDIDKAAIYFANYLNIKISVDFLNRIPKTGGVQIIANHNGEFLDVIILIAICGKIRTDFKFLATSQIENIPLFKPFCFYTSTDNETKILNELADFLVSGNALCYYPFTFKLLAKNNKLRHNVSPLPYYLSKKKSIPISPLALSFRKTLRGRVFTHLEKLCVKNGLPRLAFFFRLIEVIFSLRTLRAMQGKTVQVNVGHLTTAPLERLSREEAMNFVKNQLQV